MPAPAPAYTAQDTIGEVPRVNTTTVAIPHYPDLVAPAVGALGAAGEELAGKLLHANAVTRAMTARTNFMTGLAALTDKYRNDPDPASAAVRFQKDVADLKADQLNSIAMPQLRAMADYHMTIQSLQAGRQMQNFSLRRELDNNVDGLKTRRAGYLQAAATAGSATERDEITGAYDNEVDTLGGAGFFNPAQTDAAKATFRSDVAKADASHAIVANPDHAAAALGDAESFPGLDPFARAQLQLQAADAADAASWRNQERADTAATRALGAGALTQADLERIAPQLSGAALHSLQSALNPQGQNFDPQLYGEYLSRAADGEAMAVPAASAFAAGKLDKDAFTRIMSVSDNAGQDLDAEQPWRVDQRKNLYTMLAPQPGQSAASARAQLDAAAGFDQWLNQNPDATQDQSQAQMETVAGQARAAAASADRATLPLPAGVTAPRNQIGGDDIVDAATRLRDAHDAFAVDDATMAAQANLLRAWQGVVNGGSGSNSQ